MSNVINLNFQDTIITQWEEAVDKESAEKTLAFKYFNGNFYLLELNTQPGMTKLSLVPEIALYKGISFLKLIEWMLKDASKKK